MLKSILSVLILFFIFPTNSSAFNLRKIGNPDISGSMVNSIYQDKQGLIWIGTTVGMSTYDGKNTIRIQGFNGVNNISGTATGAIVAESLYGVNYFYGDPATAKTYEMFNNVSFSASDSKGNLFVIQGNGSVYYKANTQNNFDNILINGLLSGNIRSFFIDKTDVLRIIMANGLLRSFRIADNEGSIMLDEEKSAQIPDILFCFSDENDTYIIDGEYKLQRLSLPDCQTSFISDLRPLLADKGTLNTAVVFKNEFYFGTEIGLYAIREGKSVKIPVNKGIHCLLKDRFQDLIWIGTAGGGLCTYSFDSFTINTHVFQDFMPSISKPVAAVYLDQQGTLWLGTEGEGIVQIADYDPDNEISGVSMLTLKDGLTDNSVWAISESAYGTWIGCRSGLAFYSDKHKTINKIGMKGVSLRNIRAICEQDSMLWVVCYEQGIAKMELIFKNGLPEIKSIEMLTTDNGNEASNRFSSLFVDRKGIWFANNGNGVFRFENRQFLPYRFNNNLFLAVNEILAAGNGYLAATDFGIVKFIPDVPNSNEMVLLNDIAAKSILHSHWNDYWLSLDNGLAIYNTDLNTLRVFDQAYGLAVTEYVPGASFFNEKSGVMFFGGINGFAAVKYNNYDEAMDYMPMLNVGKLLLFGTERNVGDFMKNDSKTLTFQPDENFFSVTFNALDYINGNHYTYYYKIGENGHWVNNGNSGTISFTGLAPGHYNLFVKYYNQMLDKESYTQSLSIRVLPPWYRSVSVYIVYCLLLTLSIGWVILSVSKRRRRKREEENRHTEQQRKEEIYEAKLDFFTDIAHEFCTPLTLIYGPCNRILEQKSITPSVAKYASVISRNATRMNSLISDLMEFKQIESGYRQPQIIALNIAEITDRIAETFKPVTPGTKINIKKLYHADMVWNTDEKFIVTIITNLLSNAVKYSGEGEIVKIGISVEHDHLKIVVSNRGKGISEADIGNIFNRYTVLNNLDKQTGWQQNGLGLSITAGMVKLLQGEIDVKSIPGETTTFTVLLPQMQENASRDTTGLQIIAPVSAEVSIPAMHHEYKEDLPTVTIIDDDPEMLWFICDLLNREFNVIPVDDPRQAIEILSRQHTDAILCDVMMEGLDGITLTLTLKSDKSTAHIPLIIVSAAHEINKQTEAIDAGAEMYITKPFNPDYLKTAIRRLLGRKEDLKDYFASPLSAFELNMGKLQHSEHRKFIKKIHAIINKNIQNEALSPDFIAAELGMSTRSLYRKLKEATDTGLLEMIHEGRLATARDLLLKSKLTIDEIVFKSGFANRAGFYRAFSKKYGCTPIEYKERNKVI